MSTKQIKESVTPIRIDSIKPFADHPFRIEQDAAMAELKESVALNGVLEPVLLRPKGDGYEMLSGHRRMAVCKELGIETIPAIVRDLEDAEATLAMVDANRQREHLYPSEKAFAYKMKMEALNRQGQTCGQVGHKSRDSLSDIESGRQVQRYIRLTHLSRSLLNLVDEGQIALTPAVELSFLTESEQADLTEAIAYAGATPSLSQAQQMKRLSQEGRLTAKEITRILSEPKPNQREQLRLRRDDLKRFFPANCSDEQMKRDILRGLELLHKQRSRGQER